jgi:hypothetical protein
LTGNALRVREVQVVEEQLSVSDSNTDNTSDKLPTTRAEKYSEVATEKYYREQNLLPVYFFHCKQGNQSICYAKTNCFHFVKIDNQKN